MASDILLPKFVAICACAEVASSDEGEEVDIPEGCRIVVCLIAAGDITSSAASSESSESKADVDIVSMMLLDILANGRGAEGRLPLSEILAANRLGVAVNGGDDIGFPSASTSGLAVGSPSSSSSSFNTDELSFIGLEGLILIEDIVNESPRPPNDSPDGLLGRESEPSRDDRG